MLINVRCESFNSAVFQHCAEMMLSISFFDSNKVRGECFLAYLGWVRGVSELGEREVSRGEQLT